MRIAAYVFTSEGVAFLQSLGFVRKLTDTIRDGPKFWILLWERFVSSSSLFRVSFNSNQNSQPLSQNPIQQPPRNSQPLPQNLVQQPPQNFQPFPQNLVQQPSSMQNSQVNFDVDPSWNPFADNPSTLDKKKALLEQLSPAERTEILKALGVNTEVQKEGESDQGLCAICLENEANTVLLECSHQCACHQCATQLQNCPICRARIVRVVKVFKT